MAAPDRQRFEVRRAGPGDWQHVRNVRLAMLLDSPRAFGSTYARDAALDDAEWAARLAPERHPCWLAWTTEPRLPVRPVGSVTVLRPEPDDPGDHPHLVAMWVSPSARGMGVGAALVAEAVAYARDDLGADLLFLDVADDNEAAVSLYRRAGFVPTGVTGWLPWDERVTESELALALRPGVEVPTSPTTPPRPCA